MERNRNVVGIQEQFPQGRNWAREVLLRANILLLATLAIGLSKQSDSEYAETAVAITRDEKGKDLSSREEALGKLVEQVVGEQFFEVRRRIGRKKMDQDKLNAQVTDFETLGINSNKIRELLSPMMPKGWLGEVDFIFYVDQDQKMPEEYGLEGDNAGAIIGTDAKGVSTIDLFRSRNMPNDSINRVHKIISYLLHEFGHANDWENDDSCLAQDKMELLRRVVERYMTGKNKYPSVYVERIRRKNQGRKKYLEVKEYWAEICAEYFLNPEQFKNDYPDDFQLVDWWVKRHDQNFGPRTSQDYQTRRDRLFARAEQEKTQPDIVDRFPQGGEKMTTAKRLIKESSPRSLSKGARAPRGGKY